MNPRSPLDALARKLFSSEEPDEADAGKAGLPRRCEAGHVMDPGWAVCPYCRTKKAITEKAMEAQDDKPVAAGDDRSTRIGGPGPAAGRVTRVDAPEPTQASRPPQADTRRITGVLVTYTWQPAGQLFAIREGKNYLGAGRVSDEGGIPCHVQITSDPELSGAHALILCRHGRYDLVDLNSSNGTFLNDQMVPIQGIELPDDAKIKTGSTVWKFLRIDANLPSGGGAAVQEPARQEPGAASDLTGVR